MRGGERVSSAFLARVAALSAGDFVPGLAGSAVIRARVAQALRRVPIPEASLILVIEGRKTLGLKTLGLKTLGSKGDDGETVWPGQVLALAADVEENIGNLPSDDPPTGQYLALAMAFQPEILADFHRDYLPLVAGLSPLARRQILAVEDLPEALLRAAEALAQPTLPDVLRRHRLLEALLIAALAGVRFAVAEETPEGRLRRLMAAHPARPWAAADAARALAVSEPTLRRRLSEKGTSFRLLLRDVRLLHGLMLLQTTEKAITEVAFDCGYESPSRFAARFRERFGCTPSAVRGEMGNAESMSERG